MAENDVTIQINLDAKDAQAAIELFGRESVRVLKKTEDQTNSFFDTFKGAKTKVVGAIAAIVAAYQTMSEAINQAAEDAKLTRQIEASLRATDEASKDAVDGVLKFADALKEATGISDDLIKQTFITAKSFGTTADQAKELTKAALDLAAATGVDVDSAVRQLGGTLDGSIGKIGNLGAEFRGLTSEQLKAGEAIALVNQKFGGTAAKEIDTYQGSVNQLKNSYDDFLKVLGKTVVESDSAKNAISSLAAVIDSFNKTISDTRDTSENLDKSVGILYALGASSSQVEKTVNAALKAQESFNFLGSTIGKQSKEVSQGFDAIVKSAEGSTNAFGDFEDRLASFPQTVIPIIQKTGKEIEDLEKKNKKLIEDAAKFKEGIFGQFGTESEREAVKAQQALQKLADFESTLVKGKPLISAKEAYDIRIKIVEDFNRKQSELIQKNVDEEKKGYDEILKAAKEANDQIRQEASAQSQFLKSVFENPFANLGDKLQAQIVRAIEFIKSGVDIGSPFKEGEIAASIAGGLALVLQGKQGATKAISGVAEKIGESFGIPGLGAITELLSRGPEATKAFIKEFIKSVPDIIQAISESIPVVVETLVDVLVNRGGAARIGIAIAKAMVFQPIWGRLGQEIFGKSGNEIAEVIRNGVTEGGTNARDGFKDFFANFIPSLTAAGKNFGRDINLSFQQASKTLGPTLKKSFDNFSTTVSDFIKAIGPGLSQFVSEIPNAIFSALSGLFRELGNAISGPINQVLEPIKSGFVQLNDSLNKLIDPIERLRIAIENASGQEARDKALDAAKKYAKSFVPGGSATIEAGTKILNKVPGFSNGGLVYAADGFNPRGTDTVPAMLTPGEMVIPRDMVGELAAYLQRQSPDSANSDTAVLAAILSAVQAPIVVKTEAKVNQNAFADIILQLNRQNARLTA